MQRDKYFWKAVELGCDEFRYEPNGVGVGVAQQIKVILKTPEDGGDLPMDHKARKMTIVAWNPGGSVMRPSEQDYADTDNIEFFENAKAQAWWKVRTEFLNTYRFANGKDHDSEQLISFPDDMSPQNGKVGSGTITASICPV